ncbi:MAG TPA: outer membrane protein assembly factor BamA [Xanthobacteraceae bacterium]|jgi:outer membrane protein insertion porin family|nr:outer membrane protein assembly factor BamA [Xanthobacteraceae bacterium]
MRDLRTFWLIGGIAIAAMAQGALVPALAQSDTSATIRVEGNRRIEAQSIRSYFPAERDGRFTADDLDAALKALYATQLFSDVHIGRSGGQIVVKVVENPTLGRVAFEGNKKLKEADLAKEIQSKSGGPLARPTVQADVARVVDIYRRRGYFDAKVEPKVIAQPNGRSDLVFEIHEGAKTGVSEIRFVGNHAVSTEALRGTIKTGTTNLLSFLLDNDLYDPDQIEGDRIALRRYYLNRGFVDMRVTSATSQYDPAQKGIVVTFTIDEGSQYRIGTVEIKSQIANFDPASLATPPRPAAGEVFDAETVQKTVEALTLAAARHGQPFVGVQPHEDRDEASHRINLTYVLGEGPRRYVERIEIHGNTKTQDAVIRREFDLAEGDAENQALIARAERRLKNLGYFKTVKITEAPGSAPDRVIINVEVEDQATGDFSISGGYSTADGLLAEVSIGEKNLMGTGIAASASVTYGQYTKGFKLSVTEPHVADTGISVGGDLFAKQSIANDYQSYGSETYGATVRVGTALTEDVGIQWHYSLYRQSLSLTPALMDCSPTNPPPGCYANGEASLPVKQAVLAGPAWVSTIGSTVNYSTLDNIRSPTSGVYSSLNQDLAGLGGDVKFLRTTEDFRAYQPVAGDLVGVVRGQGGYITPWGGQSLPLIDGFFGGPQLIRGFAPNGFGPRDLTPGTTMDNVGGTQYWATSAELQTPAPLLPTSTGLKLAVFADLGSVWGYRAPSSSSGPALSQSMQVSSANVLRSSVGASLIWDSPFGPLRANYALPISKATYDVTQRFNFTAGAF